MQHFQDQQQDLLRQYQSEVQRRTETLAALNSEDLPVINLREIVEHPRVADAALSPFIQLDALALEDISRWWGKMSEATEHFLRKADQYKGTNTSSRAHAIFMDAATIASLKLFQEKQEEVPSPHIVILRRVLQGQIRSFNEQMDDSKETPYIQIRGASAGVTILTAMTSYLESAALNVEHSQHNSLFSPATIQPFAFAWKNLPASPWGSLKNLC